ncbi:MAG TPA: XVIPCD domain-containing protein [Dyella sp.]|uniref:XVIPCD domain-containing protein n=1 Tax=Dyella sp. TaxID=1869338 RepID=UPI002CB7113F|nr:XVIPCD domain-containing protein [Dyella sp.]HUB90190.1 XVIPCD domain-containing protein [Dyella sp.]
MPAFQNEQALLQQLRTSGDPACVARADALQRLYHDRQLALLSADVYAAAKGAGAPPPGWTRVSEYLELMRQFASQLHLSDAQLTELLKPRASGFRAEIYLPDPALLGPGYQPTVAFKGSTGEVLTVNGLRDTSKEDFLANNFPQSIGMETDYYDRAMDLAWQLQQHSLPVEYTGHSLGGGLASAASAIGGAPATTFNAAGLHPLTAKRFAEQNDLPVYDVQQHITAYHVQNELLNDGVQNNLHTLDEARRAQVGQVLGDAAQLLHALPAVREPLLRKLNADMPDYAQATVNAFIDRLAAGDTAPMLRALPLAAGTPQPPLTAMAWGEYQPVPRQDAMTLQEVALLSKPLLEVVSQMEHGAERGAHLGRALGVAADDMLLGTTLQAGGASFGGLPGPVTARMVDARLHQTPEQQAIDHHPTLTAATGAAGGLAAGLGAVHAQFNPGLLHLGRSLSNTVATRKVLSQGAAAGAEAADRHGMVTMLPSLEARIQETEWAARMALPRTVEAPAVSHAVAPHAAAHVMTHQPGVAATVQPTRRQAEPAAAAPTPPHAADAAARAAQLADIPRQIVPLQQRTIEEKEAAQRAADARTAPELASMARHHEAAAIPDHLRDFRHPDHPMHPRYQHVLDEVHYMEDQHKIQHGEHSERLAAAVMDKLHEERFGQLERLELRKQGEHMQVVAHQSRPSVYMPEREVSMGVNPATVRSVEAVAHAWSKRAMPHLHEPAPAMAPELRRDPHTLPAHDLRHPDHPQHALYQHVYAQVADAFAKAGVPRNETQLEHATAATMLQAQISQIDWSRPARIALAQDPASGIVGPDSNLLIRTPDRVFGHLHEVVPAQAMQQAPETSFQHMGQVAQQQAQEWAAFEQQLAQANMQQHLYPAMPGGGPGGGR